MFCTKCGKKLPENSNFCQYCGNPVKKEPLSLLERARKQDQDALAEIYEQSSLAVYKVIKILIKDEDTVYDILQDTYVKAFTRLDQLQDERKLIPWLKVIANNTARDWLKKRKPVLFTDMSADDESDDFSFAESIEDTRTTLNPEIAMDKPAGCFWRFSISSQKTSDWSSVCFIMKKCLSGIFQLFLESVKTP